MHFCSFTSDLECQSEKPHIFVCKIGDFLSYFVVHSKTSQRNLPETSWIFLLYQQNIWCKNVWLRSCVVSPQKRKVKSNSLRHRKGDARFHTVVITIESVPHITPKSPLCDSLVQADLDTSIGLLVVILSIGCFLLVENLASNLVPLRCKTCLLSWRGYANTRCGWKLW